MKRTIVSLILAVILGVVTFKITKAFQVAPAYKTRTPYTVVEVHQSPPPAASAPIERQTEFPRMIAVKSDGSRVTISLTPGGSRSKFGDRLVVLPLQAKEVYVLDDLKLKTTTPLPPPAKPNDVSQVAINPSCAGISYQSVFLKKDTFLSYDTYVYQRTGSTPQGGTQTITYWFAPQLDCVMLESYLEVKEPSGVSKTFRNYTTSVQIGEPDPSLFIVPDEYTEVSPSGMENARAKALGRSALPDRVVESLRRRDDAYIKAHQAGAPSQR
jgi:hypothetical protein